jgi:transposase
MARTTPRALRSLVIERAHGRCEYCGLPAEAAWSSHQVDHIIAKKHGGLWAVRNLAYACFECNHHKGTDYRSFDPQTGRDVRLFNPRVQKWGTHFELKTDGTIFPRTAAGRATARLLHFDEAWRIRMRADLIASEQMNVKLAQS